MGNKQKYNVIPGAIKHRPFQSRKHGKIRNTSEENGEK
jgi:hypothetical protein